MSSSTRKWGRLGKAAGVFMLLALFSFVFVGSGLAADIRTGDPNVVVAEDEVIDDDLFISGARVEVNGTVTGDLFITGQELILNGTVEGNVLMSGQFLTLDGYVGGSLAAGGFSLTLGPDAEVERNLYFGGFSVNTEDGSSVGRNLYVGGYQVIMDGEVGRDVQAGVGAFELNGPVGGDLNVEVGQTESGADQPTQFMMPWMPASVQVIEQGFHGDEANVGGQANITITPVEVTMPEAPDVEISPVAVAANYVRARVGEFISLLIVGGLLLYFFRDRVQEVMDEIQAKPFPSLGWGLLVVALIPPAIALAVFLVVVAVLFGSFITLGELTGTLIGFGGIGLTSFWTILGFVLFLVTKAIVAYLVGRVVLLRLTPATIEGRWGHLWSLVVGVLIYEILRALPFGLGWLVAAVVILIGTGAIFSVYRARLQARSVEA